MAADHRLHDPAGTVYTAAPTAAPCGSEAAACALAARPDVVWRLEDKAPATLDEAKREHVAAVLRYTRGHQGRAARVLGISDKTLYRYMRRWNLGRRRDA